MAKKSNKRKLKTEIKAKNVTKEPEVEVLDAIRYSDEPPIKKTKWLNKQRVLVLATRGITYRDRHLMNNIKQMLPHSKSEPKMEAKDLHLVVNEICEMKNCNKSIFFENRKRKDLYMWISNVPNGPSAKFLVENVHTMQELRMTGNCLKGCRPLLSFDPMFDKHIHYSLLKEMFIQIFGIPNNHPKSQPFFDHVLSFNILDHKIWFRNYQIVEEDGSLAEIGPRFVLNLIKIFDSSFSGRILYSNPNYVSPNRHRRQLKNMVSNKYKDRISAKKGRENREPKGTSYADVDQNDDIFNTITPEVAKGVAKNVFRRNKD
ncbi:ribosome biogenesis protein BRX1 homolog [Oppia nitens]|uniref:ribosome biogenesis protein BRX1 homolog n=1 Tax=Oppia nitens TaxID=1686743 RepID=UPI0023DAF4EE|nr:ribosome biogenesis protein BRX1 homolog [Oppia nitens]